MKRNNTQSDMCILMHNACVQKHKLFIIYLIGVRKRRQTKIINRKKNSSTNLNHNLIKNININTIHPKLVLLLETIYLL